MKDKFRHWNTGIGKDGKQNCLCSRITENPKDTRGLYIEKLAGKCELIGEVERYPGKGENLTKTIFN